MITGDYETKLQACNLCDALHRNINDDFQSVSFDFDDKNDIQVKIVMNKNIEQNNELFEDISVEFSAVQMTDCVESFLVTLAKDDNLPLKNVVYRQGTVSP